MNLAARLNRQVLDLVFPRRCVGCGAEGRWICLKCRESLQPVYMKKEVGGGSVVSIFDFNIRLVRETLHNLKYDGVRELADELGEALSGCDLSGLPKNAVLIPVPLSSARRKARGYNQAEELATVLGRLIGAPVWPDALRREGRVKTQVGRTAGEREQMKKGFVWNEQSIPAEYMNLEWVIVDDIMTTGATLNECMTVLRSYAAKKVSGLTIAAKL